MFSTSSVQKLLFSLYDFIYSGHLFLLCQIYLRKDHIHCRNQKETQSIFWDQLCSQFLCVWTFYGWLRRGAFSAHQAWSFFAVCGIFLLHVFGVRYRPVPSTDVFNITSLESHVYEVKIRVYSEILVKKEVTCQWIGVPDSQLKETPEVTKILYIKVENLAQGIKTNPRHSVTRA